jgi:hypothetical protein
MTISSLQTSLKTHYIPGGTGTVLFNKWTSRFINDITDPTDMGRWSGMKLRINDDINLHYITAY